MIADEIYALSVFDESTKFFSILSLPIPDPQRVHFIWGASKVCFPIMLLCVNTVIITVMWPAYDMMKLYTSSSTCLGLLWTVKCNVIWNATIRKYKNVEIFLDLFRLFSLDNFICDYSNLWTNDFRHEMVCLQKGQSNYTNMASHDYLTLWTPPKLKVDHWFFVHATQYHVW